MSEWTVYHKPKYDSDREQWVIRVTEGGETINRIWCDTRDEAQAEYEEKVDDYVSMYTDPQN